MGVTLERAWKICAYLDELERERCASDVRRAAVMTAPHGPVEGNEEWQKLDA